MVRQDERERRIAILRRAAPFFGTVQPAKLLRENDRFGSLLRSPAEGIFKPQWATHALSITSMLSSPYADQIQYLPDRSWTMAYSPKAGGLHTASNRALIECMQDKEPLLILRQTSDKKSSKGSFYLIAGLGLILAFDAGQQVFHLRGLHTEEINAYLYEGEELADDLIEIAVRLESLKKWTPFVQETRAIYRVNRLKREAAFREIVLKNYGYTCAVTGQRFVRGPCVEAEAAHIISKELKGTDDPRNGLALSRTAHWAFDRGLFTITDQLEVLVHKKALDADHRLFPIVEAQGKLISQPRESFFCPHPEALEWHRTERFGAFLRDQA